MKDGTQRGIREVWRNDRGREKAGESRTLPPLLPPLLFRSFLGQQTVAGVGLRSQEMDRECYGEKKEGEGVGGVIGHARQYILPSRPTLHPSSPPTSPPSLTTLICFPLCLIRTRWIRLSSPASLLLNLPPSSRPPFSSLSPPGFARLWHPTDFVTLWFLARREKYQAESRFQQAKNEGLTEWELWEHKKAFLCLLQLLSLYFPYLVCLLASYFHSCWFFGVNAGFLL